MANVGYATLQVIPSFKGAQAALSSGLTGPATAAGAEAGEKSGSAFHDGLVKWGKRAAIGLAAAGGAFAVKSFFNAAEFEKQMNEVFTLLPDLSGKAMGEMTGQVKDFSKEFGVLPKEVVPALYQAISAGVPSDNVFSFLETAQKAAKGGVTELSTAVDGITSVVNAYGADVVSATQASDLMFTAVKGGKTTFAELSQSLFNVTPVASALGVKFGDVTAGLAAMTAQGVPTSVATTQMRQLFVELSKAGGETAETFTKIAGKSFKEFIAEGGNVQGALQLLEQHAADSGVGINDLFGSVEAGSAALALTGKGTEKFSKELAAAGESAGATDGAFKRMNQGMGPLIDKFKAWFAVLSINVGEKIAKVVEWLQKHKTVAIALAAVLGGVLLIAIGAYTASMIAAAAATVVAMAPFLLIVAAIALVVAGIVLLYTKWDEIWNAVANHPALLLILAPLGAILIPIIALVAAVKLVQANWETIWPILQGIVETVWGALQVVFAALDSAIRAVGTAAEFVRGLWDAAWPTIQSILETAWSVMQGILNTLRGAVSAVGSAAEAVRDAFDAAWPTISAAVETAWGILQVPLGALRDVLDVIWDVGKKIGGLAFDAFTAALNAIWDGAQWGLTHLANILGRIVDAARTAKAAVDKVLNAGGPSDVGWAGPVGDLLGIGGSRAAGGPVAGRRTYLVGEQGPELFVPGASGTIVPNHHLGGGGAVHMHGEWVFPNVRSAADAEELFRTVRRLGGVN